MTREPGDTIQPPALCSRLDGTCYPWACSVTYKKAEKRKKEKKTGRWEHHSGRETRMKQRLLPLTGADCREGQEGTRGNTCKLRARPATGSWQAARVPVSFDCGDIVHISWDAGDCVQWKAFAGELRQLPLGANAHRWRWLLGVSREMPWGEQQAHQGLRLSLLVLSASVKGLRAAHLPSSSSSLPLLSSFCLDAFWPSHLLQPKWQRERVRLVPKGGLAPKSPASLPGI